MRLGAIHRPAPAGLVPLGRRVRLAALAEPAEVNWFNYRPPDGNALGNDRVGNCVPCAELRAIELRRAVAWGDAWAPSEADAVGLYSALTGYNPATGMPDDGTDTTAAMTAWAQQGIRTDAQDLDVVGWAPLDIEDDPGMARAMGHFGPMQVTLALPLAARDTSTWSEPPGDGDAWQAASWGYHRVCGGRWRDGWLGVRSWGVDYDLHPAWRARYLAAADATLSRDWMDATGRSAPGLDWDALAADMALGARPRG